MPLHAASTSPRLTKHTHKHHTDRQTENTVKSPTSETKWRLFAHARTHQVVVGGAWRQVRTDNVRAQVVADLPQDEVDVILSGDGVGCHAGGRVGGTSDGHLLPGQEEDDTAVAGCRV